MSNELEENIRAEYIKKLKEGIQDYRRRNESITGRMGDIAFSVSDEDLFEISFSNNGKKKLVVINEEGRYSEFEAISEKRKIHYRSNGKPDETLTFSRTVSVINAEEVNEYYSIKSENQDGIESEILQEILSNNREYSIGQDGEFYREGIDPSENVKRIIYSELEGFFVVESMSAKSTTYADYVVAAKQFEERCIDIYGLFIDAYRELGIQSKKSKLDAELNSEDDTEQRLGKIERAKGLMKLSRSQDEEIAELESRINQEGIGLDEQ